MKFAIIPWGEEFSHDQMFNVDDEVINRDHLMEPMKSLQDYFLQNGDELHTIDVYEDINTVDYFLFFRLDWGKFQEIVKIGKEDRMVYCTCEPPSVDIRNTPRSYKYLKKLFPYILSWNDEWVDNINIFKRNSAYQVYDSRAGALPFSEKKLITFISGNKESSYPGELYTERKRAIEYFENNFPDEFDFYGTGWDKEKHPCYCGSPKNKKEIFHKYKFAICYENISMSGYITEKIFDCLSSGIIPIYAGASNICQYVPRECFISADDFSSYAELAKYISDVGEDEYNQFLQAIDRFIINGTPREFTGERYAEYIYAAVSHSKPEFRTSILMMWYYRMWFRVYRIIVKTKNRYLHI